jgi:hypothetical protein
MQSNSWSEASHIEIFIAEDLQQTESLLIQSLQVAQEGSVRLLGKGQVELQVEE